MSETKTKKTSSSAGRSLGAKSLTLAQKAEAAALWRSGTVTLEDLAKRYGRRPETLSRMFRKMGIEKGASLAATMKKAEETITTATVSDLEETLKRIATVKDSHFRMSQAIAVMAYREVQQARTAGVDVAKLKETMSTYKLLSEIVGNSRKELFEILNVEHHDKTVDVDDLPDLTVRELTQDEVCQLRDVPADDPDGLTLGEGMLDLDDET